MNSGESIYYTEKNWFGSSEQKPEAKNSLKLKEKGKKKEKIQTLHSNKVITMNSRESIYQTEKKLVWQLGIET